ncbi:MAG: choice-of-anchor tandem repeat GloVer-containing protein [Terriglobales bacterium]
MKNTVLWLAVIFVAAAPALSQVNYYPLHYFLGGGTDGGLPTGDLLIDSAGNIYGTTTAGGASYDSGFDSCPQGCGTVFELSPESNGGYSYAVLYSFCATSALCPDGAYPQAGLVIDQSGNLYGTTLEGGSEQSGTVFELSPPSLPGGAWTEAVLHSFCTTYSCTDGYFPYSKLVLDEQGVLYGTASAGGSSTNCRGGCGTVFRLTPPPAPGGYWKESEIYTFCSPPNRGHCPDGSTPMVGLTVGKAGVLYGTTRYGGISYSEGSGTIFKLSHGPSGWTESVVLTFPRAENSVGELALDPEGRIYAVSVRDSGTLVRVDPENGVTRTFQVVYPNFDEIVTSGPFVDSTRKVVFVTPSALQGGEFAYQATLEIAPPGQETPIVSFCGFFGGCGPTSTLVEDTFGNLYGVTEYGGEDDCTGPLFNGCGVVFEVRLSTSSRGQMSSAPDSSRNRDTSP